MLYFAGHLFNKEKSDELRKRLILSNSWGDGKMSAKGNPVKRNLQLSNCDEKANITGEVIEKIENNSRIYNFSFPAKIFNVLFTRTGVGMYYGPHSDVPYIKTGRRDLSFTIFLNNPNEYEGGELILYITPETKKIKLNQGDIIIYPTKYLHEVTQVTKGERMVCVGWIESQISRDDDRESLSLMRSGISEITKQLGNANAPAIQNLNVGFSQIYKRFLN
tara:strand:- start:24 stop:683 length:660 start_codon:yes stop_codon:yes gene_type:complete